MTNAVVFRYDETLVCEECKTNDRVHYNMFVRHGYEDTNEDPDTPVWCNNCGATGMVNPKDID